MFVSTDSKGVDMGTEENLVFAMKFYFACFGAFFPMTLLVHMLVASFQLRMLEKVLKN